MHVRTTVNQNEVNEELACERRKRRRAWMVAVIAVVLAWATPALSRTTVPYIFSPNTPARASEINANFAAVANAIDAVDTVTDARLDALETRLSAVESRDDFVPSGTIAFFGTAACPAGWSEHAGSRGRYIVAMPAGGTVNGTIGSPMSNRQDRTHDHSIAHRHEWANFNSGNRAWQSYRSTTGGRSVIVDWGGGIGNNSGRYPLEYETGSGSLYTGDPTTSNSGAASTSDIAPYIQLLACQKS